jgi:two-component system, LytTR family, response regulator
MGDLKLLIVDDEPLARARLKRLLSQIGGSIVVGECGDGEEVLRALQATSVDAILLDISMPMLTGIEVAEKFGTSAMPSIIFVTAHSQYAVKAFGLDAIDYLLKPVSVARLSEALDKVRRFRAVTASADTSQIGRLELTSKGRKSFVDISTAETLYSVGNYVRVHDGNKEVEVRATLSSFATQLDRLDYLRVHRSILVRQSNVVSISALGSGRYSLELKSGRTISTGRSYRTQVQRAFSLKMGRS